MKGLVLTYLVTAVAALGALRYPLIGLYVYVAFAVLRPQAIWGYAGDLSGLSLIVGVAMLVGWAISGLGSWRWGRARPVVWSFLAFVAWFGLSALMALDTKRAFDSVMDFSRLVLPFLVAVTLLKGERASRPLLWTIVLCQGYVGFENNLNYMFKGYNTAAVGFGGMDNNCFGVSLVCVIGPAVTLFLASKTWIGRLLAAASGALILHTALLTFSRGTMIGLLAVAAAAVVLMPKRPKYLGAVLVTVLIAVRLTGPQLAERYATTFAESTARDSSAESRIDLWRDCLLVIEDHPVLGVGPANWAVIVSRFGWPEGKSAHSVWMETAAEVGIPGVLALFSFFMWTIVRLWPIARARHTDANRYDVALASGVILSVVGFVVSGQFVSVPGLEVPYYVAIVGVALLKGQDERMAAAVPSVGNRPLPSRIAPASLRRLPARESLNRS